MKRHLPGTKGSRFGNLSLSDHLPDPRYAAIPDMRRRNVFSGGSMVNALAAVAVSTTTTTYTTEPLRVRSAQVGAVTGGTITVQVQADGRDLFDDTQRPASGAAPKEATDLYIIPAGTPITTTIEADSGIPTGTANVVLETEPFRLLPQLETVVLRRGDRLHVSRRNEAEIANSGRSLIGTGLLGAKDSQSDLGWQQLRELIGITNANLLNSDAIAKASAGGAGQHPGAPGGPPRPGGPRPGGR